MVFIGGGWGPRRRRKRYDPYNQDPYNQDPYNQPPPGYGYPRQYGYRRSYGYGYGGGGSCLRDMLLVEGGCCIAESLGCGPQLLLATPTLIRQRRPVGQSRVRASAVTSGSWLKRMLLSLIAFYQREISPRRPDCCRFSPTCSHYAVEALERHGVLRGGLLTARRIIRCRPGAHGGDDPVPG
jgi:uncharacterized protein